MGETTDNLIGHRKERNSWQELWPKHEFILDSQSYFPLNPSAKWKFSDLDDDPWGKQYLSLKTFSFLKLEDSLFSTLCGGPGCRVWDMAPYLSLPFSVVLSPSASWKWEESLAMGCGLWLPRLLFKSTDTELVLLCLPALSEVETTGKGGGQYGRHSRCWPTLAFNAVLCLFWGIWFILSGHTFLYCSCHVFLMLLTSSHSEHRLHTASMSVSPLPKDISSYKYPLRWHRCSLLSVRFWTSSRGQLFLYLGTFQTPALLKHL